jgi:Kef-type K+ transport system membrane component KefB
LHICFPNVISVPCAITLGAIASATAPAATLMVVRQYKADGPLTRLLMLVVAIDDAVGLVLFSVSFGVATALSQGHVSVLAVVVEPLVEIVLSLGLGSLMGWLLNWVEQFFHSRSKRMTISVAFVLLTVGLSSLKFEIAGIHCGFSLLLVCMMTGTIFCNICSTSEELMDRVDGWTMPLNILFFVISGAELDLAVVINPVTILVGVIYILARSADKYYGAGLSCRLTKQSKPICDNLGITLLPQAGVALGMAMTAMALSDGSLVRNVVLFSVLIYELFGPALTKRSLLLAGEIRPEGKTSARTPNKPSEPVNIHQ